VVEARQLAPRLGGVASFAPGGRSVRANLLHAFGELPFVWIFVAGGASEVVPMVEDNRLRRCIRVLRLLMTIAAGDRYVPAC